MDFLRSAWLKRLKAPWPDFEGSDIFAGDTIFHPVSGQSGTVVYFPDRESDSDKWLVDYGDDINSRLCLQIGDKGQAIVKK